MCYFISTCIVKHVIRIFKKANKIGGENTHQTDIAPNKSSIFSYCSVFGCSRVETSGFFRLFINVYKQFPKENHAKIKLLTV